MKEIKFRGKVLKGEKKGEWVYGDLTQYSKVMSYIIVNLLDDNGTFQVEAKTVDQFTGLQDKNKKEIYESDIIQHQNEEADKTPYKVPKICPENWEILLGIGDSEWDMGNNRYSNIEIIGNIYENKDLIK